MPIRISFYYNKGDLLENIEEFIYVTCIYYNDLGSCPLSKCILDKYGIFIFPYPYYGCKKIKLDWVQYLKYKQYTIPIYR